MRPTPSRAVRPLLREPALVIGEIAALALAGVLGAVRPEWRVFQSAGFAALALLIAASLLVVVLSQFRRRRVGSLVFHSGMLLIMVAGACRALFASEAVVDWLEGETLAPTPAAWSAQWPGRFAAPLQLPYPVTLESVRGSRYSSGDLRDLRVRLSAGELAVNRQFRIDGCRLYLGQEFGPAALLEWSPGRREAALLVEQARGAFEGVSDGPAGFRAHLRAHAARPSVVEVRVMRGAGLIAAASLRIGESLALPGGARLAVCGAPMWARVHGSRDPALWIAYLGFALLIAGAVVLFVLSSPRGSGASGPAAAGRAHAGAAARAMAPALAVLVLPLGCQRPDHAEARQLVTRYNAVVAEAYRRGDAKLVDPVVGPNEGRKIAGLIGVRRDLGLTLDAQLLALEVTRVGREKDELKVTTRERWRYCDRRIGTGAQVGQASLDAYEMSYRFRRMNREWVVAEIRFASPPQVGRKQMPWLASHEAGKP